jgi:hypothetical protein
MTLTYIRNVAEGKKQVPVAVYLSITATILKRGLRRGRICKNHPTG